MCNEAIQFPDHRGVVTDEAVFGDEAVEVERDGKDADAEMKVVECLLSCLRIVKESRAVISPAEQCGGDDEQHGGIGPRGHFSAKSADAARVAGLRIVSDGVTFDGFFDAFAASAEVDDDDALRQASEDGRPHADAEMPIVKRLRAAARPPS